MTGRAPNYLWRKQTTADWLQEREQQLEAHTSGKHALIVRPDHARITIEFFCENIRLARGLAKIFGGSIISLPSDWKARLFEKHETKPQCVGGRLIVRSNPDIDSAKPILLIPAGAAFGTGEHVTTAMSLRLLEQITRTRPPGWRMLDAGTGSGILALAAGKFGAGEVVAIDNDPDAIRTARENARCNSIRGVKFVCGDIGKLMSGQFDIIAANLYSDLLARVLPLFRKCLRENGRLILSGVLRTQEAELTRALRTSGFCVLEARRRGKWIALLVSLRRPARNRKELVTITSRSTSLQRKRS